ncbi:protein PLANT CADMIUM RESISTANCE 8-like [Dioscorea cayenensis subsp. rotundata]|uniref:Protein PLANT CADMIUM RESISTANCE 8-like n=1 Tax=Dioscorea cayennensis subsp. rotundata TaxID=55577 RepID=A0AB40B8A7_DIOCR|nr:protein PLANT CADMIUM RESISTANCE 8-like [Dioscorea cayenensis subsp. rotundata]
MGSSWNENSGPETYPPTAPYPPPHTDPPSRVAPGTPTTYPPMNIASQGGHVGSPYRPGTPSVGRPWSTGLFDCGQNQTNAIMTAFFPCVTFGQIAEILDEGETSCTLGSFMYILMVPALLTCWIMGSNYRRKLRNKYNLVQAPAEDWTVHLFCPCCSLCQEFRELHNRGIDPSLGWMGYLAQQQQGTTTIEPPKDQFMTK